MTLPILIRPRAFRDLDDLAEYLGKQSERTARRFESAVEQTLEAIGAMPEIGSVYTQTNPQRRELRWRSVRKFKNHLIFYCIFDERIDIVRVLYGTRNLEAFLDQEVLE